MAASAPALRSTVLLLGRIAVEKGYLRPRDLDRCVCAQVGDPFRRDGRFMTPLGEILVSRGYLSGEQLEEVLDEQRRRVREASTPSGRPADALFGQLVVKERLASREAVNAVLRLQAVMEELGVREIPRLGQLLMERGCLKAGDVDRLIARQAGGTLS